MNEREKEIQVLGDIIDGVFCDLCVDSFVSADYLAKSIISSGYLRKSEVLERLPDEIIEMGQFDCGYNHAIKTIRPIIESM